MHADPELLSLLALGEQAGTRDERIHAETCPECAGELSALQRLVTLGRSVGEDTTLLAPSPGVWARIQDELALGSAVPALAAPASSAPAEEVRAHAELRPVGASWGHASGAAELGTDEKGRRLLQVALRAELPPTGLRQAWLVHKDDPGLRQSLGILDGRHGLWTVEHSIDLTQFTILDISQQDTGETEHSGQTIVRGEFTLVG